MQVLDWLSYQILWFQTAFEFPLWIVSIPPFLFSLSRIIPMRYQPVWGNPMINIWYQRIRKYSPPVLLIIILIGIIQAPYSMYLDTQRSSSQIIQGKEQQIRNLDIFKPVLNITPGQLVTKEESNDMVVIQFPFALTNIGENTAYHVQVREAFAPMWDLETTTAIKPWIAASPVFKGEQMNANKITFNLGTANSSGGNIVFYLNVKYSDAEEGGRPYEDTKWYVFILDAVSKTTTMANPDIRYIDPARPYIMAKLADAEIQDKLEDQIKNKE